MTASFKINSVAALSQHFVERHQQAASQLELKLAFTPPFLSSTFQDLDLPPSLSPTTQESLTPATQCAPPQASSLTARLANALPVNMPVLRILSTIVP